MADNISKQMAFLQKLRPFAVVALRWAVGAVFIFSGLAKGIDLWGVIYKVSDYLDAFGWEWAMPYVDAVSVMVPVVEFTIGVLLFAGSFRRVSVWLALAIMAFMLPLTAYIAIYEPVADCGCFGEAWVISNTATFWKNVAITLALIFLLWKNRTVRSLYGPAVQWLTVVFPVVYLLVVMAIGYKSQPLIDFRPYKTGTYIVGEHGGTGGVEYSFVYEKDGVRKQFSLENLPDTTWTFVDRKEYVPDTVVNAGKTVNRIAFFDGDYDVTDEMLPEEGDVLLLLIPDLSEVNVASTFRINEMYESLSDSGIMMICLTGGSDSEISDWREMSMANYPIYKMDDTEIKTMARGNPALVRVNDGMIVWKMSLGAVDLTDIHKMDVESGDGFSALVGLSALLILLMAILLVVNRTPLLVKFTIRLKKNRKKK